MVDRGRLSPRNRIAYVPPWISLDQCADMHGIHGATAEFADAGFCTGAAAGSDMSEMLMSNPATSADPYNHYSLLATIQHMWRPRLPRQHLRHEGARS